MKKLLTVSLVLMTACLTAAPLASRPFIMPLAAEVRETAKDGKGWLETGIARMTYVQAKGQFRASLAQSGWTHLHTVVLSSRNERSLLTWKKGNRELTTMLWRIDVGRTGFSWGVSMPETKVNEKRGKLR